MVTATERGISVQSDAFNDGERIPKRYTSEGENLSPSISWTNVPSGTQELVLMVEDPDGTAGNFSHWLVYNIPPALQVLPEGIEPVPEPKNPQGIHQGRNSFAAMGYAGPLPKPGSGPHHYHFRLFALDTRLEVLQGMDKEDVQSQMIGHVIAQGDLVGIYER